MYQNKLVFEIQLTSYFYGLLPKREQASVYKFPFWINLSTTQKFRSGLQEINLYAEYIKSEG